MSGVEIPAIIACVAALISAYHDGGRIVHALKKKREETNALPPTQYLEQSLALGPREIELQSNAILDQFGTSAQVEGAESDRIYITLLEAQCQLQYTLLEQLRQAVEDDGMIDFQELINASNRARIKTVRTLCELQEHMFAAAEPTSALPVRPTPRPIEGQQLAVREPAGPPARTSPPFKPISRAPSGRQTGGYPEASGSDGASTPGISRAGTYSRSSTLIGDITPPEHIRERPKAKTWRSSFPIIGRQRSGSGDSRRDSGISGTPLHYSLQDQPSPGRILASGDQAREPHHDDNNSFTLAAEGTNPWAGEDAAEPPRPAFAYPEPSKENKYLGFCEGASTFDITARPRLRGERVKNWYYGCPNRKCQFGMNEFAPAVFEPAAGGMKLRWAFLARSHVLKPNVKDNIYSYRCMFCVLTGRETGVFAGVEHFLMHIAEHRDDEMDNELLRRVECISGREAEDREFFAINLYRQPVRTNSKAASTIPDRPDRWTAANYVMIARDSWSS